MFPQWWGSSSVICLFRGHFFCNLQKGGIGPGRGPALCPDILFYQINKCQSLQVKVKYTIKAKALGFTFPRLNRRSQHLISGLISVYYLDVEKEGPANQERKEERLTILCQ